MHPGAFSYSHKFDTRFKTQEICEFIVGADIIRPRGSMLRFRQEFLRIQKFLP